MYALIENHKVIGVFEPEETEIITLKDGQTLVPIDEQCLFSVYGNTVVGELVNDGEEWVIQEEYCQHSLEDCDGWQPIGNWSSF